MTSRRYRAGAPVSTITSPDEQRPPRIGTDPIVALWVPAVGIDVALPYDLRFTLGRGDGSGALIQHPGVSRHHADVERDGNDLRIVNRSKNGIEFRGAMRAELTLTAGDVMKVDKVEAFALTRAMMEARQRSAYFLGFGPESMAMYAVRAAALGMSVILECPPGAPRGAIASALMQASPREARRHDVMGDHVPRDPDEIRDLCAKVAGGLVYVDAAVLPNMPASARPRFAFELLQAKWNLIQVWSCDTAAEVYALLGEKATAGWSCLQVPTVAARVARRELPAMIDYLFAALAVGHRSRDLDRSEARPNLRGLLAYDWPGNHDELRLCVGYMAARLNGASQERAAEVLGCDRSFLRRRVIKWGLSL